MPKPQDLQSIPAKGADVDPDTVDRISELIESSLNDAAGSAADFSLVASHSESTHTDDLD